MKTSTHLKPLLFWLITAVFLIFSMVFVNNHVGHAQEMEEATATSLTPRSPSSYPADPTGDIGWSGGASGVADIQNAFNNGRFVENSQLGTSTPMLTLPAQAEWDGMSDNEKALWLINRERIDRGVMPLHDVEPNVTGIAQYYANYLLDNDAWGHEEDGNDPWERLDTNPTINGCHDFLNVAENLAVFVTSGNSISLPVERAVYNWMYDDASSGWGHRHAILWYPYNDNSGVNGREGFLGIGRASGGPYQGQFSEPWNFAELIVMNVFDPCASWQYPAEPPSITSITPAYGENTGTVHITNLAGTDFVIDGVTAVSLQKSGETPITATNVTVVSEWQITCDFDLAGAAIGDWNVVVVNPDGESDTLANGFAVQGEPPVVTSITPNSGRNNGTTHINDLAGSHFWTTGITAVELRKSGQASIIATNVSVLSGSQISCDFDLAGAAIGDWDVVVINPDSTVGTLTDGFTVEVAPIITSVTPAHGENTGIVHISNLAGMNFSTTGETAVELRKSGEASIVATNVTVVNGAKITCDFDLAGATTGRWDVVVINPDDGVGILADGFLISNVLDNFTYLPAIMKTGSPPSFELGGQTSDLNNPNFMSYAGMNWVKFQYKWDENDDPDDLAVYINQAHANGFKVLLTIVGATTYPYSIDFAGYTAFVGQVATLAPDAIEIWNKENVDFWWPAGQIDPASYVSDLLAPSYNAIKAANPNVMVIGGALIPTGYFDGGCSPNGCDDNAYLAGMATAGAAAYMDCMGVNYVGGATSPYETSGHPADIEYEHYSWYFQLMVDLYANALGKPLCFTELGYLSGEDFGGVPSRFWWAGDTTVSQHAQWLAEAVSLANDDGRVRMAIVFNVDYVSWGDDPQAGYAMIRPDGSCPACETLRAVMVEE